MEKKNVNITREELDDFMRQLEGMKSTIEILQNKDLMGQIRESEELKRKGVKPIRVSF